MNPRPLAAALLAGALGAVPRQDPAPQAPILHIAAEIPLPGPPVRFDYQSFDLGKNRLYLAHMGAGELIVFDLQHRRVERTLAGLPGITGVWAVPALGKVYASVSKLHHVAVIDDRSFAVLARVGDIGFPDGIAYAPDQQKIYVSDESGGGELVIEGRTDRVFGRIPLDGEAGNTIFDPGSRTIMIAVQTRNEVYVVDPVDDHILGRFPLAGAARPHGLALDAVRRLAFVANERDAKLLVVDLNRMRVIDTEAVGDDPDVLAFDPGWRRLYVASESGRISVFSETSSGLVSDGDVVMPHAHSVSVDPRTHLVYVPLEDVAGRPVLRILEARPPRGL